MIFTATDYLVMFLSSYGVVFLLGIQSKNVMNSRYVAAMFTSLGISVANFLFAKYASVGGIYEFATCATGGVLGIASSIWVYDNILKRKKP